MLCIQPGKHLSFYIKCEADERIRRALCHQVRAVEDLLESGKMVYYKRDGSTKWLDLGKVIFQDGRLVFVWHGGVYVRASANRLIKCRKEFKIKGDAGSYGGKDVLTGLMTKIDEVWGRLIELKHKHVHGNGIFGVQNGVADDNIECDTVDNGADANEDFIVENEVVGENIEQGVVGCGVEGNFEVGVNSDDLCVDQVESLGEDRNQMIEGVGGIESGDVAVGTDTGNHPKGVLKKNDSIDFKVNEKDKWTVATILGRAENSAGKNKSWYNAHNHEWVQVTA